MLFSKEKPQSLINTISNHRSIRRYEPHTISTETLEQIIRNAMLAPSPKHRQPWKVTLLTGLEKENYVNAATTWLEERKAQKIHYGSLEISIRTMHESSALFVIYNPYDKELNYHHVWEKSDLQAIGAFIEHILLSATALDLGTCGLTMYLLSIVKPKYVLTIDHTITAIIAIGKPGESPYQRPRKELWEVLD